MRSWVYTFTAHFPGFNLFRLNGICRLQRFFLFLSRALIFSSVRSSLFARQNHGKPTKIFMTYHFTRFLPSFVFFIRHEMPLSFFIPHLFTFFPFYLMLCVVVFSAVFRIARASHHFVCITFSSIFISIFGFDWQANWTNWVRQRETHTKNPRRKILLSSRRLQ